MNIIEDYENFAANPSYKEFLRIYDLIRENSEGEFTPQQAFTEFVSSEVINIGSAELAYDVTRAAANVVLREHPNLPYFGMNLDEFWVSPWSVSSYDPVELAVYRAIFMFEDDEGVIVEIDEAGRIMMREAFNYMLARQASKQMILDALASRHPHYCDNDVEADDAEYADKLAIERYNWIMN